MMLQPCVILRNSCCAQFREVKDISSGEMDVPEGPKSHLRAEDQPCCPTHIAS